MSVKMYFVAPLVALIANPAAAAAQVIEAASPRPQRIISVNLCADQMLLHLADRSQIAGLSRNAADPGLSAQAGRAEGLPIMRDSAEILLASAPDMIIAIPKRRSGALASLGSQNYQVIDAHSATSYGEIISQLRQFGQAVGHPARAEKLIGIMDARLAKLPDRPGKNRVAAYYQRRGFMTGTGTLIDDLMSRLGLVNLAGQLGRPALSQLSLEELVAAKPDFLIMESATADITDQGTEMLHHPALADIPRLWVPQAWTVCGTPEYALAAKSLAEQIAAIDRKRATH